MSPLASSSASAVAVIAALVTLSVLSSGTHAFGVHHPVGKHSQQQQQQLDLVKPSFLSVTSSSSSSYLSSSYNNNDNNGGYGRNDYDSYESRGGGGGSRGGGERERRGGGGGGGGERGGGGGRHDYERDTSDDNSNVDVNAVNTLLTERLQARKTGQFDTADAIRDELMGEHGVVVWDREKTWRTGASASGSGGGNRRSPGNDRNGGRNDRNAGRGGRGGGRGGGGGRRSMDFGPTGHDYEVSSEAGPIQSMYSEPEIHELIAERLQCKMSRDFNTADAIQADLIAAGVYVHDGLKEWRADGQTFGDYNGTGNSAGPGVTRGSRNDRSRPYEQSTYSVTQSEDGTSFSADDLAEFQSLVEERSQAKMNRDYVTADAIREDLRAQSILIDDKLKEWSVGGDFGPDASSYSQDKDRPYAKSQLSAALETNDDGLEDMIQSELERRGQAKQDRDFDVADSIREELASKYNVIINDRLREWSVGGDFGEGGPPDRNRPYVRRGGGDLTEDQVSTIQSMVFERAEAKKNRDFDVADEIRDELRDTYSVSLDDKTREWRILSEEYALVSADGSNANPANLDDATLQLIQEKLVERSRAKVNREYDIADDIRDELRETYSVNVNDRTREWRIEPQDNDNNDNYYAPQQTRDSEPKFEFASEDEPTTTVVESVEHDDTSAGQDQDLSSLTVVELKEKLRAAGRPISGKKAELIERLLE